MNLKIVHGAPLSGKSTYVRKNRGEKDMVYDYDEIARALTYGDKHLSERSLIHHYILDIRLAIVRRLRQETELENVWILSSFLTESFRKFIADMDPEYIKMDVTLEECLDRLEKDDMRPDKEAWRKKVEEWFEKYGNPPELEDDEDEEKEVKSMPIKVGQREYRNLFQLQPIQDQQKRIESDHYVEGYATTWTPYLLWEHDGVQYFERIDRRAFDDADMSDIIMQYDHAGKVYARTSNRTLIVEPDDHGLFICADLSKSPGAKDLHTEIDSGLVTKMSWAFTVAEESYNADTRTRTILKVKKVYDVSAVSIPANDGTEISARSFLDGVIQAEKQELLERERQIQIFNFRKGIKR